MNQTSLSVVIVAMNEERTIGEVLSAVRPIAGEIILVDSGSSDGTLDIAKSYEVKLFHQDWLGYSAQKNYALSLAKQEWILSLDADEIVTPDLVAEIEQVLSSDRSKSFDGFKIPRILYIGQTAITHGGFYPDAQLRLFRRGTGEFRQRLVHEAVSVKGQVGKLQHPMRHMAYKDVAGFEEAMEKYARLSAQEFMKVGYSRWKVSPVNELLHPLWTFFFRYIVRCGFLDGALGLKLSLIYSDYVRRKIRYLRQAEKSSLSA